MSKLLENLFNVFKDHFNTLPSIFFRDKSGESGFMVVEVDLVSDLEPFPCINVRC